MLAWVGDPTLYRSDSGGESRDNHESGDDEVSYEP